MLAVDSCITLFQAAFGADDLTMSGFDNLNDLGTATEMGADPGYIAVTKLEQIFEPDQVKGLFGVLGGFEVPEHLRLVSVQLR